MFNKYMNEALSLAKQAAKLDEVPVGAVIVKNGEIIAAAHNRRQTDKNALSHAECEAIKEACKKLGSWRLDDCDLYVTLEPCPMCAGAIINSRIRRVYFGATDERFGACGSVVDLFNSPFNHKVECYIGIMEKECSEVLSDFFSKKRLEKD